MKNFCQQGAGGNDGNKTNTVGTSDRKVSMKISSKTRAAEMENDSQRKRTMPKPKRKLIVGVYKKPPPFVVCKNYHVRSADGNILPCIASAVASVSAKRLRKAFKANKEVIYPAGEEKLLLDYYVVRMYQDTLLSEDEIETLAKKRTIRTKLDYLIEVTGRNMCRGFTINNPSLCRQTHQPPCQC